MWLQVSPGCTFLVRRAIPKNVYTAAYTCYVRGEMQKPVQRRVLVNVLDTYQIIAQADMMYEEDEAGRDRINQSNELFGKVNVALFRKRAQRTARNR